MRALELIGRDVDKAKYAALLEEVRARAAAAGRADPAAPDRPQHNRTWAAYQRRREARRKNVQLERLKWLLGLPNRWARAGWGGGVAGECGRASERFAGRGSCWEARPEPGRRPRRLGACAHWPCLAPPPPPAPPRSYYSSDSEVEPGGPEADDDWEEDSLR